MRWRCGGRQPAPDRPTVPHRYGVIILLTLTLNCRTGAMAKEWDERAEGACRVLKLHRTLSVCSGCRETHHGEAAANPRRVGNASMSA